MGRPMERREWKAATRSRARAGAAVTWPPPSNATWIQHAGSSEVGPHFLSRCICSCSRLCSCMLSVSFSSFRFLCYSGWRLEGPCPIQNAKTDGAYFLYASLSFYVHEDFGLSCFSLLIADAYSSVYYNARWSRKRDSF
jgi:hypothetical protein